MSGHQLPEVQDIVKKTLIQCGFLNIGCAIAKGSCSHNHCMDICSTTDTFLKSVICACDSSVRDSSKIAFVGQVCHVENGSYWVECAQGKIDMRNLVKGVLDMVKDGTLSTGTSLSGDFKLNDSLEAGLSNSLVGFATAECYCGAKNNNKLCAIGNYCMKDECYCIPFIFSKERCNCASEFYCNANSVCNFGISDDNDGYGRVYAQCYETNPSSSPDSADFLPNFIQNNSNSTKTGYYQQAFFEYGLWKSAVVGLATGLLLSWAVASLVMKLAIRTKKLK